MAKTPPSKLAFSRIVEIDRHLRSRSLPALADLATEFGVSRRTVERDIESLRDYFGAPIEWDRKAGTYKYSNANFSLPAITLSQEELHSLLVAERALRQYSGTPFEVSSDDSLVHRTINKIISLLPGEKKLTQDLKDLCSAVAFENGPPVTDYTPEVFKILLDSVAREQRVEMTYYSISSDKITTRRVEPYHVVNWGGDWYLIAFCCTRNEVRNFHLGRIRSARILHDDQFIKPVDFDPKKYMAQGFGHMVTGKKEKVKIRVYPPAARWVKEKIWHPSQVMRVHRDGSLEMTMEVSAPDAVKRWVLQFGSQAEILEPGSLRREIKEELAKAGWRYK